MASSSETGHAKNIGNLKKLNEFNTGFGIAYNPTLARIKNAAMITQHTTCDGLQLAVSTQNGLFFPIRNARKDLFATAKPLARRIRSAAKTSGVGASFVKNVNTVVTKILGERIKPATPTPGDPAGTSASQQSYDKIVDHFEALGEILAGQPGYNPDSADLQTAAVQTFATSLETANDAVKAGAVPYNAAITERNKALYTTDTGLVSVAQLSKEYVKEKFTASSPEYALVKGIKFVKMKDVD